MFWNFHMFAELFKRNKLRSFFVCEYFKLWNALLNFAILNCTAHSIPHSQSWIKVHTILHLKLLNCSSIYINTFCFTILHYTVLYNNILHCIDLHCIELMRTVWHWTVVVMFFTEQLCSPLSCILVLVCYVACTLNVTNEMNDLECCTVLYSAFCSIVL